MTTDDIAAKASCDTTDDSSSDCSDEDWSTEGSKVTKNMIVMETSEWNGSEITYFRMLHPIFVNNFCDIAKLLRSKTCIEVFEHAQCVAMEVRKPKDRRRLISKKKKKSMRCVRV